MPTEQTATVTAATTSKLTENLAIAASESVKALSAFEGVDGKVPADTFTALLKALDAARYLSSLTFRDYRAQS